MGFSQGWGLAEQVLQKVTGRVSPGVNASMAKFLLTGPTWKEEEMPAGSRWPLGKEKGVRTARWPWGPDRVEGDQ